MISAAWAFFCEYASFDRFGRPSMQALTDTYLVPSFPFTLTSGCIVAKVTSIEAVVDFKLRVTYPQGGGVNIGQGTEAVRIEQHHDHFIFSVRTLDIPSTGVYRFSLVTADGADSPLVSVNFRLPPPRSAGGADGPQVTH